MNATRVLTTLGLLCASWLLADARGIAAGEPPDAETPPARANPGVFLGLGWRTGALAAGATKCPPPIIDGTRGRGDDWPIPALGATRVTRRRQMRYASHTAYQLLASLYAANYDEFADEGAGACLRSVETVGGKYVAARALRRRVAATPRLRRGYSVETSRGDTAAATRMFRGDRHTTTQAHVPRRGFRPASGSARVCQDGPGVVGRSVANDRTRESARRRGRAGASAAPRGSAVPIGARKFDGDGLRRRRAVSTPTGMGRGDAAATTRGLDAPASQDPGT